MSDAFTNQNPRRQIQIPNVRGRSVDVAEPEVTLLLFQVAHQQPWLRYDANEPDDDKDRRTRGREREWLGQSRGRSCGLQQLGQSGSKEYDWRLNSPFSVQAGPARGRQLRRQMRRSARGHTAAGARVICDAEYAPLVAVRSRCQMRESLRIGYLSARLRSEGI
jgi:hypothetical protein